MERKLNMLPPISLHRFSEFVTILLDPEVSPVDFHESCFQISAKKKKKKTIKGNFLYFQEKYKESQLWDSGVLFFFSSLRSNQQRLQFGFEQAKTNKTTLAADS